MFVPEIDHDLVSCARASRFLRMTRSGGVARSSLSPRRAVPHAGDVRSGAAIDPAVVGGDDPRSYAKAVERASGEGSKTPDGGISVPLVARTCSGSHAGKARKRRGAGWILRRVAGGGAAIRRRPRSFCRDSSSTVTALAHSRPTGCKVQSLTPFSGRKVQCLTPFSGRFSGPKV